MLTADAQIFCQGDSCQRVVYVVNAYDAQFYLVALLSMMQSVAAAAHLVKADVRGIVIVYGFVTIGDHRAGQIRSQFCHVVDHTVDDERAVCRQQFHKFAEGSTDLRDVPEKVQVVFFDI